MLLHSVLLLAAAAVGNAHFNLLYPQTAGFDDDAEGTSPCGGATVTVNSSSPQVQVDRFAVSLLSTHPTGTWAIRGTNSTKEPYDFVDIVPVITTTGIGQFCLSNIHAPSGWAGKSGVLQVIDYSIDGTLYQCAPVNWASGSNSTIGSACKNATGFTATWTTETSAQANSTNTSSSSSPATSSSSTPSPTSKSAASKLSAYGSVIGLGLLAAGFVL